MVLRLHFFDETFLIVLIFFLTIFQFYLWKEVKILLLHYFVYQTIRLIEKLFFDFLTLVSIKTFFLF
jgi:hypothetical protein